MTYHIINIVVYVISVGLAMIGLSCFKFENYVKPNKIKQFYLFYLLTSIGLGYLFGSFILSFGTLSFYS